MIASLHIFVDAAYHEVIRFQKSAFFTKILRVSVTSRKRKEMADSPSASLLHTRRNPKKEKTGEETPRSVLIASSLRSIAPPIPVVSVAIRRRFAAFRISHHSFVSDQDVWLPQSFQPVFHREMQQVQSWFVLILFSSLILRSVTGSPRI